MNRPSWDEYFMEMAELTAKRSTCMRRNVGAVIVKDKRAIATGYNGAPMGIAHCEEKGGCLRQQVAVVVLHARAHRDQANEEQNQQDYCKNRHTFSS